MSKGDISILSEESNRKGTRDRSRWNRLNHATNTLKEYFIGDGDTPATAKLKVNQLSDEASVSGEPILNYILGNKQPLKNKINASALSFMDASAKAAILDKL